MPRPPKNQTKKSVSLPTEESVDRQLAEKSLFEFVKQAWSVVESTEFKDNWHIRAICSHLEAVIDGRIKQIIFNVPPGSMKSLLVCVFWPAWVWTKRPEKRFLFASYADALTMRDSVRCRQVLDSQWYQRQWPIKMRDDQNTKGLFENTSGGWRLATSVGGRGTGLHPDFVCVAPEILIQTDAGEIPIGRIVNEKLPVRVLSFNHESGKKEWKTILEYECNKGHASVRIRTSGGSIIECTDEHPIYRNGFGYIGAATLEVGSELFALPKAVLCETESPEKVLQLQMLDAAPATEQSAVRDVRENLHHTANSSGEKEKTLLFKTVLCQSKHRNESQSLSWECYNRLQSLFKRFFSAGLLSRARNCKILFSEVQRNWKPNPFRKTSVRGVSETDAAASIKQEKILQSSLRFDSSPRGSIWQEKRNVCSRPDDELSDRLSQNENHHQEDGWEYLRDLRHDGAAARKETSSPSCQLHQGRFVGGQSDDLLPVLSRQVSREAISEEEMAIETVVSIERIPPPPLVYNLNVEGNHNYFADGILVHNCADDPNNAKDAESEAERQNVIDWWDGTISTRGISRGVAQLCIQQRLHTNDLTGHLLTKGTWEHISLPMRFEAGRMQPTSLGFTDPRTMDGELLWPSLFPEEMVAKLERTMGIYFAAGQLQQRPSPRGGGMFKREWFDSILPIIPPDVLSWVRYWDKAGTATGEGARTAGALVGKRSNGRFVLADMVKGRWSSADREAVIKSTAALDVQRFRGVTVWVEQEPGSGGKESAENTVKNLAGLSCKIERVTGAKEVRAEPAAAQCAVHNVDLIAGHWVEEFIQEAESFPMGNLKDQIDAFGGALNKLAAGTGAFGSSSELTSSPSSRQDSGIGFERISSRRGNFF